MEMPGSDLKIVLVSEDPHILFSRVRFFQRNVRSVRVEVEMRFPEVRAGIFPIDGPGGSARVAASVLKTFKKRFLRYLVSEKGQSLPKRLVKTLAGKKMKLACAESCSGGMMANLVTAVFGSSSVFEAGIVTYGNDAKVSLLGVKKGTLERNGAVSKRVVEEMLHGAVSRTGADCAAATSGIAGPTGGTREKPVGLVYCGALSGGRTVVKKVWLAGMGRSDIKVLSAYVAMKLLLDNL